MYYSKDLTKAKLIKDIKSTDAIIYCTLEIGKNVEKISEDFKSKNPLLNSLDWAFLSEFSNDYLFSDEDVWDVINSQGSGLLNFLPQLKKVYLSNIQNDNSDHEEAENRVDNKQNKFQPDTHYKNPIHSHTSVWTVRKR